MDEINVDEEIGEEIMETSEWDEEFIRTNSKEAVEKEHSCVSLEEEVQHGTTVRKGVKKVKKESQN